MGRSTYFPLISSYFRDMFCFKNNLCCISLCFLQALKHFIYRRTITWFNFNHFGYYLFNFTTHNYYWFTPSNKFLPRIILCINRKNTIIRTILMKDQSKLKHISHRKNVLQIFSPITRPTCNTALIQSHLWTKP